MTVIRLLECSRILQGFNCCAGGLFSRSFGDYWVGDWKRFWTVMLVILIIITIVAAAVLLLECCIHLKQFRLGTVWQMLVPWWRHPAVVTDFHYLFVVMTRDETVTTIRRGSDKLNCLRVVWSGQPLEHVLFHWNRHCMLLQQVVIDTV